jgi:uncharacterized protein (TIGR02246 family)
VKVEAPDDLDQEIKNLLSRMVAAWDAGDARAYAREFTEEANYVIYAGIAYRGREEIERGHVPVFETYQRGSTMRIRVLSATHLSDDVAVVLTEGGLGKRKPGKLNKVQTFTLVRQDGTWRCAAFQNTKKNRVMVAVNAWDTRRRERAST